MSARLRQAQPERVGAVPRLRQAQPKQIGLMPRLRQSKPQRMSGTQALTGLAPTVGFALLHRGAHPLLRADAAGRRERTDPVQQTGATQHGRYQAPAAGRAGPATGRVNSVAVVASSPASRYTAPSSTFTANFGVHPSSGAEAWPSHRPIVQLCSGHATWVPN